MSRIFVLVGLPGCGKTSWCKSKLRAIDVYIDGDSFKSLSDLIDHVQSISLNPSSNLYLDGLFLTKDVQDRLKRSLYNVQFVLFTPNIPNSLFNDAKRARPTLAATTIRNAQVHKPQSYTELPTMKFDSTHEILARICGDSFSVPTTLESYQWSLGGTSGNCWDDHLTTISPDDPIDILDFIRDDSTITDICKFLNYPPEQLALNYSHLFTEDSESEGDYYGGVETRACWQVCPRAIVQVIIEDLHAIPAGDDYQQLLPELFV